MQRGLCVWPLSEREVVFKLSHANQTEYLS